ncbi:unnamed protein product [Auanema sp. JU1783]|nr:unnamed protein product [Auanema sp. JU1783]
MPDVSANPPMSNSQSSQGVNAVSSVGAQMQAMIAQANAQAVQAAAQLGALPIGAQQPNANGNFPINGIANGNLLQTANQPQNPGAAPGNNNTPRQAATTQNRQEPRRSEIYRYTSEFPLFASAWSMKKSDKFRLAVGTVVDIGNNKVSLIHLDDSSIPGQLVEKAVIKTDFAANSIAFIPDLENNFPDLIALSTDGLKIYNISSDSIFKEEANLISNKSAQFSSPLTSFDWNDVDPRLIGTSSIDTTCTIYDVEVGAPIGSTKLPYNVKTQLIAHDKPVHDIGFSKIHNGRDHFATVGADGSARMFDLRHLEHSTIVYEDPTKNPLMRLAWNKHEPCYLATFAQDSVEVVIIDIRQPCHPLSKLKNHNGAVNGIAWAPHSAHHICTAGDDSQALIWDISGIPRPIDDPILAYSAGGEVNQVHWGAAHNNWISICFNKSLEILRV